MEKLFHCKYLNGMGKLLWLQTNTGLYNSQYAVQISAATNNKITLAFETKKQDTSTYFFFQTTWFHTQVEKPSLITTFADVLFC